MSHYVEQIEVAERLGLTYGGLLDNNVLDDNILQFDALRISVRLGVLQETEDELDGLLGPATFGEMSVELVRMML